MQEIIIRLIEQFGYFGVAFLVAIENLFPPIPSEVILTFSGFMTTYAHMDVWLVIISATIGSVIGAIILYYVGRLISTAYLKKLLLGSIGGILHFKPKDIERAKEWFSKRGDVTVLLCRFIPVLRSLISIPAGTAKMNFSVFIFYTTIGTFIWNTILVWLGVYAGESWRNIVNYMNEYSLITIILILVIGIIIIYRLFRRKTDVHGVSDNHKIK